MEYVYMCVCVCVCVCVCILLWRDNKQVFSVIMLPAQYNRVM